MAATLYKLNISFRTLMFEKARCDANRFERKGEIMKALGIIFLAGLLSACGGGGGGGNNPTNPPPPPPPPPAETDLEWGDNWNENDWQ